jgi:hypothetical protein
VEFVEPLVNTVNQNLVISSTLKNLRRLPSLSSILYGYEHDDEQLNSQSNLRVVAMSVSEIINQQLDDLLRQIHVEV